MFDTCSPRRHTLARSPAAPPQSAPSPSPNSPASVRSGCRRRRGFPGRASHCGPTGAGGLRLLLTALIKLTHSQRPRDQESRKRPRDAPEELRRHEGVVVVAHRRAGGVAVVDLEGLAGGGGRAGVDRVQRRRGEQRHPAQDIDFLLQIDFANAAAQKKSPRASVGRARSRGPVEVVHAVPLQQRPLVLLRRRRPDAPTLPSAATLSFFHVCKPYTDPLCKQMSVGSDWRRDSGQKEMQWVSSSQSVR